VLLFPVLALSWACSLDDGESNVSDDTQQTGSVRGMEGKPCLLDADCASGFGCVIGVCTAGCSSDDDCDGEVCDPHGYCGGPRSSTPGPLMSAPPLVASPAGPLAPGSNGVIKVHNPSADALVARLAFSDSQAMVDPAVFVVEPHGSVEVPIEIPGDTDAVEAIGALWTEHGSYPVPVLLQTELDGRWQGQVIFDDGRPLGRSGIGLDLEFDGNGEVRGRAVPGFGLMWPLEVRAEGTWSEPDEKMSLEVRDVIPAIAGVTGALESPLGREIDRRLVLNGRFTDDGRAIEGEVREVLGGLRETAVVVRGTFRLHRTGAVPGALEVPAPAGQAAVADDWLDAQTDACGGVGVEFATPAEVGLDLSYCSMCTDGSCDPYDNLGCVGGLLHHGYQFEQEIQLGELSVTVGDPFAVPPGWGTCFDAANQNYPCLDHRAVECAAQIQRARYAVTGEAEDGALMLEVLDRELTAAALLGTGHLVDAGLAYTENTPLNVAAAELASLDQADEVLRAPLARALAPGMLDIYEGMGASVLRDERGGRDLVASLAVAARRAEVQRAALRLRRRMQPGAVVQLREEAAWQAVWYHAWGALLSDLFDAYSVPDELGELEIFGETVADLDGLWRELDPTHNPLGFHPNHVPILLSAQGGTGELSNYELLASNAREGVTHFEKSVARAQHAVKEYEQNAYDAEARAAVVRDEFDAQLVSLCGADPLDPTAPQLQSCGKNSGELFTLRQRIDAAATSVDRAYAGLEANVQAIAVEQERMARRIENSEELQIELDGLEEQLIVIVDEDQKRKSVLAGKRATAECATERRINAVEAGRILATAAVESQKFSEFRSALPKALVTTLANKWKVDLQCDLIRRNAGFETQALIRDALTRKETMIVNQEINAAIRASQLNDQIIDSEATIKRIALNNEQLALDIEAAQQGLLLAGTQLSNGYELAASILSRRERALKRLTFDPQNPYLNPSFLMVRNELGRRLASDRELSLRKTYRAARALEYEINRDLPVIESTLYPSRAPTELEDVNVCLDEIFLRHQLAYGAPQQHITELSLRRDILGIAEPIEDPAGGGTVSEAEQFRAVLTQPAHMQPDGSIELTITLPIEGDGAQTASLLCNDRIETLQVEAVGDFLGDEQMVVMIGRKGSSHLRRCEAEDLAAPQRVANYSLDERRVALQAGVNDWGTAPANAGLAGWPVAGDQWVFTIPSGAVAPENADADFTRFADFLIRITHRAGTVAEQGSVDFTPTCG